MKNLKELEKKYEELGKEIERLKKERETVGFRDDPIFLLSVEEYEKYRNKIPGTCGWWWLRSPDSNSNFVLGVYSDGVVGHNSVDDNTCKVRPALRLQTQSSCSLKSPVCAFNTGAVNSECVVFNGVTWVKIDEDLYISELPIATLRFDGKSNNYQVSEIRKFLLYWLEERVCLN